MVIFWKGRCSMAPFIIGIPKEGEHSPGITERRVALTPGGVRDMVSLGAKVIVETGAGNPTGFIDADYHQVGAEVVYTHEEVFSRADLILKIAPVKNKEIKLMGQEKMILGFIHLAVVSQEVLKSIQEKKLTILGYEIMENAQGLKPILKISSEIAGKMAPQIAARLLQSPPGLGMLLSGIPGIPPADVVILGGGVLGTYAAMSFLDAGTKVNVLDANRDRLESLYTLSNGRIVTAMATEENIEKFGKFAEVLVSSVLMPGESAPLLVTNKVLKGMRRGSVVIDFSIDQGGATEITRRKGPQPDYYVEDELVFYAVPNVPSQVPRSSSHALTHAILPYLKLIMRQGCLEAIKSEAILKNAAYFYQGKCVSHHLVGRCSVEPW